MPAPGTPAPTLLTLSEQDIPDPGFVPKYDIAGRWSGGACTDVHRIGRHVFYTVKTDGFEQQFSGDYIDDHTIVGIQSRLKQADGSIALLQLTLKLDSANSGEAEQIVFNSNSDLPRGWKEILPIRRVVSSSVSPAITEQDIPDPSFIPKYDFAGEWTSDNSPEHADVSRIGKHVVCIFNNAGYEQIFEGDYRDDCTIEGIQIRRNKSDNTITLMRQTIALSSPDSGLVNWIALDSNSDLRKGQTGIAVIRRVPIPKTLVPPTQGQSPQFFNSPSGTWWNCPRTQPASIQATPAPSSPNLSSPSLNNNLLAFWNFDGSLPNSYLPDGGNLSYVLQTGNDGRGAVNPGTVVPGKIGNAIEFASTGNQGLYMPAGQIPILTTFTMTAWVKLSPLQNDNNLALIACSWDGYDGRNFLFSVLHKHLRGVIGIKGIKEVELSDTHLELTDTHWHFCVFQCSDNNFIRVKVDANDWTTLPIPGSLEGATCRPFQTGQNISQDMFNSNCSIDMLGVWDRVLSDSELARLYNQGNGLEYPFHPTGKKTRHPHAAPVKE